MVWEPVGRQPLVYPPLLDPFDRNLLLALPEDPEDHRALSRSDRLMERVERLRKPLLLQDARDREAARREKARARGGLLGLACDECGKGLLVAYARRVLEAGAHVRVPERRVVLDEVVPCEVTQVHRTALYEQKMSPDRQERREGER